MVTSEDDMRRVCTVGPPLGLSALNLAEERLTFLKIGTVLASCLLLLDVVSPLLGLPQYLHFSWPSLSSASESANLCGDRVGILSGDSSPSPGC